MADGDQVPLTGAAALRAQSKVPLSDTAKTTPPIPTTSQETAPSGAAALRAQSKVPLAGAEAPQSDAEPSWGATLARAPNQAYQGLIEGGAGLLGLPAIAEHGIGTLLGKAGITVPDNALTRFLTPKTASEMLGNAQQHIGYDPTQPTDLTSQIVRGAGQATAALPLGAEMGMGMGANAAYTYGPALAGSIAEHFGINPLLASLPTALTMSGLERKLITEPAIRSAAQEAAEKAAAEAAAAKAAKEAHTAAEPAASELATLQRQGGANLAAGFKEGSEADIAKWHDSEHAGADVDREAVASTLGQSKTTQQAGEALQDAARSWKKTEFPQQLKDAENKMYDGVVKIPQDAPGDLSNFRNSLTNSFYRAGELEPAAQQLRSRMPERLESALDDIALKQGLLPGEVPNATLSDMKKLRSILGDAMTSPKLSEGVDAGKMNELYRALSSDMEGAISNAAGSQGVAQFKKFNEEARRLYGLASGPVGDIISTTDKAGEIIRPGEAVGSVLKGSDKDASRLIQLGSEPTLKKGLDEVAASQLRTGSPDDFYKGLAPESQTALYGNNVGKVQSAIDRRVAADQGRDKMIQDVAGKAKVIKQREAAYQAGQTRARRETGVALDQEEAARKVALQEANAKLSALKNPPKTPPFGIEIPGWMKGAAGMGTLGGAFEAGRNLGPLAAHFPGWGEDVLGLTATAGAGALGLGARELWKNPAARRNLLQAGAATGTGPNALGWDVEENK
jgi:hypothetical protein